jgi:hypothetical protein
VLSQHDLQPDALLNCIWELGLISGTQQPVVLFVHAFVATGCQWHYLHFE